MASELEAAKAWALKWPPIEVDDATREKTTDLAEQYLTERDAKEDRHRARIKKVGYWAGRRAALHEITLKEAARMMTAAEQTVDERHPLRRPWVLYHEAKAISQEGYLEGVDSVRKGQNR